MEDMDGSTLVHAQRRNPPGSEWRPRGRSFSRRGEEAAGAIRTKPARQGTTYHFLGSIQTGAPESLKDLGSRQEPELMKQESLSVQNVIVTLERQVVLARGRWTSVLFRYSHGADACPECTFGLSVLQRRILKVPGHMRRFSVCVPLPIGIEHTGFFLVCSMGLG